MTVHCTTGRVLWDVVYELVKDIQTDQMTSQGEARGLVYEVGLDVKTMKYLGKIFQLERTSGNQFGNEC